MDSDPPSKPLDLRLIYAAQLGAEAGTAEERIPSSHGVRLEAFLRELAGQRSARFRKLLFRDDGSLHRALVIAIDGRQIQDPSSFPLTADHEILLLTPIAGG